MKLTKLSFLFALGILIASCGTSDEEAPVITITSPDDNITINSGDTLFLTGTVVDNEALASIIITDGTTPTTITSFDSETSHELNQGFIVVGDTIPSTLVLTITASDAEANTSSVERTITVQ